MFLEISHNSQKNICAGIYFLSLWAAASEHWKWTECSCKLCQKLISWTYVCFLTVIKTSLYSLNLIWDKIMRIVFAIFNPSYFLVNKHIQDNQISGLVLFTKINSFKLLSLFLKKAISWMFGWILNLTLKSVDVLVFLFMRNDLILRLECEPIR